MSKNERQISRCALIAVAACFLTAVAALRAADATATAGSGAPARTWMADNGNGTFTNPLFYDEFSDPDLIRVGDDFYLTGTTMHAMPGLPVLHSRDLVNWEFVSYAVQKLDFGPAYRLQGGEIYGQGIWAPCLRYHDGAFYIFSNVNGRKTQVFRATNPAGPWSHWELGSSLHDLSVLFDDDGRIYVVWGYDEIMFAELKPDLSDIIPETRRVLIPAGSGMGEGSHFYRIAGRYYIISANYAPVGRMQCARADRPEGPYETVVISARETMGTQRGWLVRNVGQRSARARARSDIRARRAGRQRLRRHGAPPGRHRRPAQRRLVGFLDDGFPVGRAHHLSLSGDLAGWLAVFRPAGKSRPLAADVDQAGGRRRRLADGSLRAQRRFLRARRCSRSGSGTTRRSTPNGRWPKSPAPCACTPSPPTSSSGPATRSRSARSGRCPRRPSSSTARASSPATSPASRC